MHMAARRMSEPYPMIFLIEAIDTSSGLPSRRRRHPRAFGAEIHSLWGVLHPAREASRKGAYFTLHARPRARVAAYTRSPDGMMLFTKPAKDAPRLRVAKVAPASIETSRPPEVPAKILLPWAKTDSTAGTLPGTNVHASPPSE